MCCVLDVPRYQTLSTQHVVNWYPDMSIFQVTESRFSRPSTMPAINNSR